MVRSPKGNARQSSTTTTVNRQQLAVTPYDRLLSLLISQPHLHLETVISQMQPFSSDATLAAQLAQIDQLKTWLDSFRPLPSAVVTELKKRYDVRFTYQSNAIEGNTLTQSETELVLSKGITIGGKTLTEHLEVIGHKEAIDYVETLSQTDTPIGEWEIRQVHSLVLRRQSPTEAGQYRQIDVKAAGTEHVYPPHYLLTGLMVDFTEWLTAAAMHPVLYASEAHYRFVSVHPFTDGNGRAGRLLMNLLLLKAGFPIVSISHEKKQQYIDALAEGQRANNNLTQLHALICEAVHTSLIETLSVVASAHDSREKASPFYQDIISFLTQQSEPPSA